VASTHVLQCCIQQFLAPLAEVYIAVGVVLVCTFLLYLKFKPTKEQRYERALESCRKELLNFIEKSNCGPILLRLAWTEAVSYDAAIAQWPLCGGVNGSVRFDSRLNEEANAGLSKAISLLTPIHRKHQTVSWADLIQMAAVVSIKIAGGPDIPLVYGREDVSADMLNFEDAVRGAVNTKQLCNVSSIAFKHFQCPVYPSAVPPYPDGAPTADVHLRNVFYRLGLNNRETVALLGAHTLGRAFKDRTGVCSFTSGDQGATVYTQSTACPKVCVLLCFGVYSSEVRPWW
jgi:L-ascorbate peroxidase